MRWLVTGAAGAIGPVLIADLAAAGHEVHAVTRPGGTPLPPWVRSLAANQIEVDLNEAEAVGRLLRTVRPDVVADLAVERDPTPDADLPVASMTSLALEAGRIGALILRAGSSTEAFAGPRPAFTGPKARQTDTLLRLAAQERVEATVLRLFHVYGAGERRHRLIPRAIDAALTGATLPLTPDGPRHDFVHVDDVTAAFLASARPDASTPSVLDVCTGAATSNHAVVDVVEEVTGMPIRRREAAFEPRPWDHADWFGDPAELTTLLGRPPIALAAGIERTVRTPLAIVAPHYRTAAATNEFHARVSHAVAVAGDPARATIIHVDDACDAGSGAALDRIAHHDRRVRVIHHERNRGQAQAVMTGLRASGSEITVALDADLQDPPEAIPALVAELERGEAHAVFAGRRGDYEGRGRLLTGHGLKRLLSLIAGTPADAGGFVALDRALVDDVVGTELDPPYLLAAIIETGRATTSIPVERQARTAGRSATTSRARMTLGLTALRAALRSRRTHPRRATRRPATNIANTKTSSTKTPSPKTRT